MASFSYLSRCAETLTGLTDAILRDVVPKLCPPKSKPRYDDNVNYVVDNYDGKDYDDMWELVPPADATKESEWELVPLPDVELDPMM